MKLSISYSIYLLEMAQTRKRAKNTLDVDSSTKLGMMQALMGKAKSGVVSYVLVYAPWCGACRKFRKNIWDPSMRFPARHNRIAIRDDVFNNSPFAKKVPDLKYLPSMILVDEKGDVQVNAAPEGPTNILPTPTSVNQLVKMANVNVKPLAVAAANQANIITDQASTVNDILSKPTRMNNVIANANKTAEIANNAAAKVKTNTVALNNASRNMLQKAITNTKVAADNARKAAGNAKQSANSIQEMLAQIKNIVASAKGTANANANTNMAAKAAAAAVAAAAAAEAAEEAANEGTNAVEEANSNTNFAVNTNENANVIEDEEEYVNANANANANANTNIMENEDWEDEDEEDEEEILNNAANASNFSPPDGMMSKNGSLTTRYPTPPVAPQNYKKPSNMVGGKRATHGKLYKMLVAMNNRKTQRRGHATSKKLTRRAN